MEVLHLPMPPTRMEILDLSRSGKCPRPKSSRLRQKIDRAYSYFTQKVDPVIAACVSAFLFRQPIDISYAMKRYFRMAYKGVVGDCFKDIKCYNPKKSQKIYFAYNLGPKLSKVIDLIAASQPFDVLSFICQVLKDQKPSHSSDENQNEFEHETYTSTTRDRIDQAITLANEISDHSNQAEISQHSTCSEEQKSSILSIKQIPKNVQISVLGMDGAGKSSIINALQGKFQLKMKPSLGFNPTTMTFGEKFCIKFYDLGGGKKIRNIWSEYYHDVHGIIYVFDGSLKNNELKESKLLFESTIKNDLLINKPILILSNKKDKTNCLSGIELYNYLNLNQYSNCSVVVAECSSFISVSKKNCFDMNPADEGVEDETLDPRLESAVENFLGIIEDNFVDLNNRVVIDVEKKKKDEIKKRHDRERKVLKNKIASKFRNIIESSLLPENLPNLSEDDSFTKEEGIIFLANEIGSDSTMLEKVIKE